MHLKSLHHLHSHIAIRAGVSERSSLFLKRDEIPDSHHSIIRHIEVKQLNAREGLESVEFARRSGEIICHKKAI